MQALRITPHNAIALIELPKREQTWMAMRDAIDCQWIDIVDVAIEGLDDFCIVCDDEGMLVDAPELNAFGSALYGFYEHGQPLFGNILVMKNAYNDDGELETVGITEREADTIVIKTIREIKKHIKR